MPHKLKRLLAFRNNDNRHFFNPISKLFLNFFKTLSPNLHHGHLFKNGGVDPLDDAYGLAVSGQKAVTVGGGISEEEKQLRQSGWSD